MEKKVVVNDMSCQHCVNRLDKALNEINVEHTIDLPTKTISFDGDESKVVEAIEAAGYTAK